MARGKHCDDPARIAVGGRFDPELEEPIWADLTDGMCTGMFCRGMDMEAWRNKANGEFRMLERQVNELEKATIAKFESIKDAPNEFKAVINNASTVLETWDRSWGKWEYGWEERWRDMLGGGVINSYAKSHIRDIINQFRDAACAYDEVVVATAEIGGYIPPEEKKVITEEEEKKRKSKAMETAATVADVGLAGFFTYKIISSR